jgi:hypothetical protein
MNSQIGRNKPCVCGSGRKYKKCCLPKKREIEKDMANGAQYIVGPGPLGLMKIKDAPAKIEKDGR